MSDTYTPESENEKRDSIACKNCGFTFKGKYCPECGQSILDYDRPFRFIVADFAGNMFAFDTRLWKTLKTVLFRPGKFPLDYISGKRIQYMPPLRIYLFFSFLYILQLNFMASDVKFFEMSYDEESTVMVDSIIQDANFLDSEEVALEFADERSADVQLDNEDDDQSAFELKMNAMADHLETTLEDVSEFQNDSADVVIDKDEIYDLKIQQMSDSIKKYTNFTLLGHEFTYDIVDIKGHTSFYIERVFKYYSWVVLLLMPFLGFLFWLFYRRYQANYTSHLILAINIMTISVILNMITFALLSLFNCGGYVLLFNFILYITYILLASMKLYNTSFKRTVKKSIPIGILYSLSTLICLSIIIVIGFSLT